jgi:hypothetical protein
MINTNYINNNIFYSPLLFHEHLIEYYNSQVKEKILFENKDIDILFFGYANERRKKILDILSTKYNVVIHSKDNNELCNNIERSKIILNIHNHEYNYVFDYYRNAFLLANKAFIIYEYPYDTNFSKEHNLIDIKNNLITIDYDQIINSIDYYMNNQNLIKEQVEKQFNWFKNFPMETNINNIFDIIYN